MRLYLICLVTPFLIVLGWTGPSSPTVTPRRPPPDCDAAKLAEIVGYTAIAASNVTGQFEGADFDKPVKLDNGMIFEFHEYNYSYSYRPDVIVFARSGTSQGTSVTLYELLIEDELYSVSRLR